MRTHRFKFLHLMVYFFVGSFLMGFGERFTDQGNALAQEINRELIASRFCSSPRNCFEKLQRYGEHGDQVNFNFYGVDAGNRKILAAVVEFVSRRGMDITKGVPIKITAFPLPHNNYTGILGSVSKQPILKLEVMK